MLKRENDLRLSPGTRDRLLEPSVRNKPHGWLAVMDELQRQVAREFGLSEDVGITALRCAERLLLGDAEVREISLYRKYNRCVDGSLHEGDVAPNAILHDSGAETTRTSLYDFLENSSKDRVVVFAGSYS